MAVAASAAQLRSGHSSHLRAHKHLTDPSVNANCPKCEEALHIVEHWLDCPGSLQARLEIIGTTEQLPLSTLLIIPGQVGRTDKAHIVTPWCACHHHQQQQQNVRLTTAVTYREVDAGIIIDLLDVSQSLV